MRQDKSDGRVFMFEIDKKQFGEFIADMRRQKMMTQKELAGEIVRIE